MKVLNLEDNAIKHYEICRILKRNGIEEIDWVRNLEDGLKKVEENKYDLYITDMWYPKHSGGPDNRSGELFIKEILKRKDPAPVILCSNHVRIRITRILRSMGHSIIQNGQTGRKNWNVISDN